MPQGKRIDDSTRASVCERYLILLSESKVAEEFGIHQVSVHNILKRAGVARRKYRRMTPEKQEQILDAWRAGDSIEDIVARFDVTSDYTYTMAREHLGPAIDFRSLRTYSLNEAAFDVLTPGAAYFIGLLMADGNVSKPRQKQQARYVTLSLAEKDKEHVAAFRNFIGSDQPIYVVDNDRNGNDAQPLHRLCVCSQHMAERLESLGLVPRKSKGTTVADCLSDDAAFWLGMIDGDGEVVLEQRKDSSIARLGLVGCRGLLDQYAAFVRRRIGVLPPVRPMGSICFVRLYGRPAETMLRILYASYPAPLPRKAEEYQRILARRAALDAKAAERAARIVPEQYQCAVEGCGKKRSGLGLCPMHYRRHRLANATEECSTADCTRKVYARGLCTNHYNRVRLDAKK